MMAPFLWLLSGMGFSILSLFIQHWSLGFLMDNHSNFSGFFFFILAILRLALAGSLLILTVRESLLCLILAFIGMVGIRWVGLIWINLRARHLPREVA